MKYYYSINHKFEAGCDEAGRGALAGPVVAASVILDKRFSHPDINDSKKINKKKRNELRLIIEKEAVSWSVAFIFQNEIDQINILNASILAMHKALNNLSIQPDFILVDGNKFKPYKNTPYKTIVRGDSHFLNIAAASILAKTHRDEYMKKIHEEYPAYGWNNNKGYPTQKHREAIKKHGITHHHRKTFNLLPPLQLKLDF